MINPIKCFRKVDKTWPNHRSVDLGCLNSLVNKVNQRMCRAGVLDPTELAGIVVWNNVRTESFKKELLQLLGENCSE